MNVLKNLAIASVLAWSASGAHADVEPAVSITKLKDGFHLLQGKGGNVVASLGADGLLIIDDDYPEMGGAYTQALQHLAGEGAVPRYVLNTHWHGDHTGNNGLWGERGAVIVAHEQVRERMSTRQVIKGLGMEVDPSPAAALPAVTYQQSMALHFNGDTVELQHYPSGHTDGDSVVFFAAANLVHMGDHFFKDAFPFVDVSSGGNVFGYLANIEAILQRVNDDTVIVPGHGGVANRADLQRYRDMLATTSGQVKAALERGDSVQTIVDRGLGAQWQSWGQGFISEENWIRFIAASL